MGLFDSDRDMADIGDEYIALENLDNKQNAPPPTSKKINILVSTLPKLDKTCKSLCRSIYTRTRFCTAVKFQYINEILAGG